MPERFTCATTGGKVNSGTLRVVPNLPRLCPSSPIEQKVATDRLTDVAGCFLCLRLYLANATRHQCLGGRIRLVPTPDRVGYGLGADRYGRRLNLQKCFIRIDEVAAVGDAKRSPRRRSHRPRRHLVPYRG
jgi:hypothetical protein